MTPSPHDFLLHLRSCRPDLARRLDGIRGLERAGRKLLIRVPEGSWSARELTGRATLLASEARHVFGSPFEVEIAGTAPAPEALPFPVLASKTWNHVAFWSWASRERGALVVRKPAYLETWLPAAAEGGEDAVATQAATEAAWLVPTGRQSTGTGRIEDTLPELVEEICALARNARSYAHLVTAFPGDRLADRVEARLYAVKDWGTPRTPAGVLQKFVGRIHYVDPDRPVLGLRLARRNLGQPQKIP